jgi:hypothetical protein
VARRRSEDPVETARAWAEEYAQASDDPQPWIAGLALEVKATHTPAGLRRWSPEDLEVVLGFLVGQALIEPDLAPAVPESVELLLEWLENSGRLAPTQAGVVLGRLEQLRPVLTEGLVDPARWSPSKRMLLAMQQAGFDLSDPRTLAGAQDWFNGLPFDERGEILGLSEEDGVDVEAEADLEVLADLLLERLGSLPAVVLPPDDEVEAGARASVWWQRVRGLCEYVGPRLAVTERGNLKLADGRVLVERLQTGDVLDEVIGTRVFRTRSTAELLVLDLVYELALSAGFLELDGRWLRASARDVALLDERPQQALHRMVMLLMTELGVRQHRAGRYGPWLPSVVFDEHVPVLLADLYGRTESLAVADLVGDLRSSLHDEAEDQGVSVELAALYADTLERGVREGLALLAEFGVLQVGADDRLALTPFGTWSVHQWLSRVMAAPTVGTLVELPAPAMLARVGDLPEEVADAEVDAWVAAHGPRDLAEALPSTDETGQRLAVAALVRIGPAAAAAVEALGEVPGFEELAEVWRAEVLSEAVPATQDVERFVRILGAVHLGWGPRAVVGWLPRVGVAPLPLVEQAWRVRLTCTADVLTALVETPDKTLSKAARRSLFKLRSLGPASAGG